MEEWETGAKSGRLPPNAGDLTSLNYMLRDMCYVLRDIMLPITYVTYYIRARARARAREFDMIQATHSYIK